MMDKYAVAENDSVESKAMEIQKTAGININEARAVAQSMIEGECATKTSKQQ